MHVTQEAEARAALLDRLEADVALFALAGSNVLGRHGRDRLAAGCMGWVMRETGAKSGRVWVSRPERALPSLSRPSLAYLRRRLCCAGGGRRAGRWGTRCRGGAGTRRRTCTRRPCGRCTGARPRGRGCRGSRRPCTGPRGRTGTGTTAAARHAGAPSRAAQPHLLYRPGARGPVAAQQTRAGVVMPPRARSLLCQQQQRLQRTLRALRRVPPLRERRPPQPPMTPFQPRRYLNPGQARPSPQANPAQQERPANAL